MELVLHLQRDPATGAKGLFGEFLLTHRGEDVVAGVRTPMHIQEMSEKFPEAFEQFKDVCATLEEHYRDMQDMEFTVESMASCSCYRHVMVRNSTGSIKDCMRPCR